MDISKEQFENYLAGHDNDSVVSARQILKFFGCCPELHDKLLERENDRIEESRVMAERFAYGETREYVDPGRKSQPERKERESEPRKLPAAVIGFCPQCNSALHGEPIPSCERSKTGRTFYAECSACTYYYEIFQHKRTKKYRREEGGIRDGKSG